jgi:hypothetical protein
VYRLHEGKTARGMEEKGKGEGEKEEEERVDKEERGGR